MTPQMTLEKGIHTKDLNQHPQDGGNPHKDLAAQLLQQYISGIAKCIYIYQLSFSSVTCHTGGICNRYTPQNGMTLEADSAYRLFPQSLSQTVTQPLVM